MKRLLLTILFFCSLTAFAQDGFFIMPEIGGGMSNTCFTPLAFSSQYHQKSIFAYQAQLEAGYQKGRWEFIAGFGYMRTGYKLSRASTFELLEGPGNPYFVPGVSQEFALAQAATALNPHLILPVKIGYRLFHLNNKLTLTPMIGAEFERNLRRTFLGSDPFAGGSNNKVVESQQEFNADCYGYGISGLVQLNFEYKASNHITITGGPSFHYNFLPLIYYDQEYDYAVLLNIGMRYDFRHKAKQADIQGAGVNL